MLQAEPSRDSPGPTRTRASRGAAAAGRAARQPGARREPGPLYAAMAQAVPGARVPEPRPVQARLSVGAVDDPLELEADRMAAHALAGAPGAPSVGAVEGRLQRRCAACADEDEVLRRTADAAPPAHRGRLEVDASLLDASASEPLGTSDRDFFGARFGRDFSAVRIHRDRAAAQAASAIGADAFTHGADLYFARGRYAPGTAGGRQLLAHELAHAVQQRGAPTPIRRQPAEPQNGPCPDYDRGEVERSHTERGVLGSAAQLLGGGDLLVADFGVDWRHVKASAATDPLLVAWLDRFERDPSYRLEVVGYSDCVGAEADNTDLRQARARNVEALLGPSARSRVTFRGMMALGSYVDDNSTAARRARNRGAVIHFSQEFDFSAEPLEITAKLCGPNITDWLVDQMNGNVGRVSAMAKRWPYWIPFFNLGYTYGALEDFKELVQAGGPWDFKAHAQALGWLHDAAYPCPSSGCNRTLTMCGMCFNYDVPGNIHFGWIGRQAGWRPWLLHHGADRAQPGGVDDPRDAEAIDIGIRMADQGTTLCDELAAQRSRLNLDKTEACVSCSDAAHP
jgi:outer membrane protein OmpA-like peptidoglycan-associated protein